LREFESGARIHPNLDPNELVSFLDRVFESAAISQRKKLKKVFSFQCQQSSPPLVKPRGGRRSEPP